MKKTKRDRNEELETVMRERGRDGRDKEGGREEGRERERLIDGQTDREGRRTVISATVIRRIKDAFGPQKGDWNVIKLKLAS